MKNVLMLVFACLAVCSARASYLYWEVNPADSGLSAVVDWASESGVNWNYAAVFAVSGKNTVTIDEVDLLNAGSSTGVQQVDLSDFDDLTGYSFYLEVGNYDDDTYTLLGTSQKSSYATLSSGKYIGAGTMSEVPDAQVWHGGTFTAAPEPTGALLMLIGVGVLGLRRRERKAA